MFQNKPITRLEYFILFFIRPKTYFSFDIDGGIILTTLKRFKGKTYILKVDMIGCKPLKPFPTTVGNMKSAVLNK